MHNMKRVIRNRALVGMLSAFLLMSGTSYSSVSVYAADGYDQGKEAASLTTDYTINNWGSGYQVLIKVKFETKK